MEKKGLATLSIIIVTLLTSVVLSPVVSIPQVALANHCASDIPDSQCPQDERARINCEAGEDVKAGKETCVCTVTNGKHQNCLNVPVSTTSSTPPITTRQPPQPCGAGSAPSCTLPTSDIFRRCGISGGSCPPSALGDTVNRVINRASEQGGDLAEKVGKKIVKDTINKALERIGGTKIPSFPPVLPGQFDPNTGQLTPDFGGPCPAVGPCI